MTHCFKKEEEEKEKAEDKIHRKKNKIQTGDFQEKGLDDCQILRARRGHVVKCQRPCHLGWDAIKQLLA